MKKTKATRVTFRIPSDVAKKVYDRSVSEHRSLNSQLIVLVEHGLTLPTR